jgi:DNA-binding response OmpR family regulator
MAAWGRRLRAREEVALREHALAAQILHPRHLTMTSRILIVDDEEAVLFGMREYFATLGYEVDCARELAKAQSLLAKISYSLVIADLRLTGPAGLEGLEVISSVRKNCTETPVVLLTAYGTPDLEAEARERGVNAVLYKPKPLREIVQLVDDLING